MLERIHPRAEANRITSIVQQVLGASAYPLDVELVLRELAPILAPGAMLDIAYRDLRSVEGALLCASSGDAWTILINRSIDNKGRRNFTAAHEAGHFLCHRLVQNSFECGPEAIDRFSTEDGEADLEEEANAFASQLLLPPNVVRRFADGAEVTFDAVAELADQMETSITAASIACVSVSSKPIGFVVVREGFVSWGRASKPAFRRGLFFKKGTPVPSASRFATDFMGAHEWFSPARVDGIWLEGERILESGFYSDRYGESYVLLDLKPT